MHSFQFLPGITVVPREIKDYGCAMLFFGGVGGGGEQGALWSEIGDFLKR